MARKNALAFRREYEHGELGGIGRCPVDQGQSIICSDRKGFGHWQHADRRLLASDGASIRAISKEDIRRPLCEPLPIHIPVGRGRRTVGTTGELERFGFERRLRAGSQTFRFGKNHKSVVPGRICARRRGSELYGRVEHPFQQISRCSCHAGADECAQFVARKENHGPRLTLALERLGVAHICRSEDLRFLSPRYRVLQQTGGAKAWRDRHTMRLGESRRHLNERATQAACCMKQDRFRSIAGGYCGQGQHQCACETAHLMPQAGWRWRRTAVRH